MSADSMRRAAFIAQAARQLVNLLEAIPADDLESAIALREKFEKEHLYTDEAAFRAGRSLTETLKMILFFRTEILAIQASEEDKTAGVRHAVDRIGNDLVREFLEGNQ